MDRNSSTAFVKPYVFSVLPPGSVPSDMKDSSGATAPAPSFIQSSVIQIRSSLSILPIQTLPFPFNVTSQSSTSVSAVPLVNASIRLLTPSPSAKSPLFLLTTPTDRTLAATEGSSIWQFRMKPWGEQVDELVRDGLYSGALALLETIDQAVLSDKVRPTKVISIQKLTIIQEQRKIRIRALNAVAQFRAGKFDDAINAFIDLDFNPAKVVALYPENVAGRLSVPHEKWISLYGGPTIDPKAEDSSSNDRSRSRERIASESRTKERTPSPTGSIRGKLKTGFSALLPSAAKDDDNASISSAKPKFKRKGRLDQIRFPFDSSFQLLFR